jgi:hypothetical protein
MAAKILSVTFQAATAALVKAAFDTWAAAGQVICEACMTANDAGTQFDLVVFYFA